MVSGGEADRPARAASFCSGQSQLRTIGAALVPPGQGAGYSGPGERWTDASSPRGLFGFHPYWGHHLPSAPGRSCSEVVGCVRVGTALTAVAGLVPRYFRTHRRPVGRQGANNLDARGWGCVGGERALLERGYFSTAGLAVRSSPVPHRHATAAHSGLIPLARDADKQPMSASSQRYTCFLSSWRVLCPSPVASV